MLTILGISGIRSNKNPIWETIGPAFLKEFPNAHFVLEEEHDCEFYEYWRFRKLTDRLVHTYDDGRDLIIVGHSMGGIVATALVGRLRKSRVICLVSIAAPHHTCGSIFSRLLQAPRDPQVPHLTFQVIPDRVVPWGTKHRHSSDHAVVRSSIPRAHKFAFVHEPQHGAFIAARVKRYLSESLQQ